MKKLLLVFAAIIFSINIIAAQNVVKCKKQESLVANKTKLTKQFGEKQTTDALNGEINEGLSEKLFLMAFNTETVPYDADGCKAYNVYTDDILKPRKPNSVKPSPVYFVIISQGKVVKIKPGEKNSRYKIKNGTVVY